jgi:hypothetical protein
MTEDMARLRVQNLILRDFVVWLLAREIGASLKPQETIRLASEFADARVHGLPNETTEDLEIAEMNQSEKDWIISAVSKVLEA